MVAPDPRDIVTTRGWAWPVELTLAVGGPRDVLMDAVLDLVACGFSTLDGIHRALGSAPYALVRGAIDHAILFGALSGEPDTGVELTDPEQRPPRLTPRRGFVVWSGLEGRLLPVVWIGDAPPPRPDLATSDVVGAGDKRPKKPDIAGRLVALAARDDLVLDGPSLPETAPPPKLDSLILAAGRPTKVSLCHYVEIRASSHGRVNLVVRRGHFSTREAAQAPVWPHGEAVLRGRADARVTMEEIDRRWREVQLRERLPMMPPGFETAEELLAHLDERIRVEVGADGLQAPWDEAELFELARRALFDGQICGAVSEHQGDLGPARAWAAFLEAVAKRLWREARPYIESPWARLPSDEEATSLRELNLGVSESHVLESLRGKSQAAVNRVRAKVPAAGGRPPKGREPDLGCGDAVLLWVLAAIVNEDGRLLHAARIRRAQSQQRDLMDLLSDLVGWRNTATHLRSSSSLPHDEVIANRSLRVWRVLGNSAWRAG